MEHPNHPSSTADADIKKMISKTVSDSHAWDLDSLEAGRGLCISFLNAHGVNTAAESPEFRAAMLASDFLLRDGVGVALGLKMLKLESTDNLNGTDLIPQILQRQKGRRIAVWGSSEEALAKLNGRLENEGQTALESFEHGFHDDDFYLDAYHRTQPEILVLCMGMPRQEILASKLMGAGASGLIICGGGWANFYSGTAKRAPMWVRRLRLEWVHRLSREPKRLGKRYTVDILRYFRHLQRIARLSVH